MNSFLYTIYTTSYNVVDKSECRLSIQNRNAKATYFPVKQQQAHIYKQMLARGAGALLF